MKQFLPLLLGCLLYACQGVSPEIIPTTIIKGHIELPPLRTNKKILKDPNYQAQLKEQTKVQLVTNAMRNGIDVPNHQTTIDENGNYRFEVKIKKPTEIRLIYRTFHQFPLYVKPGSELIIDINNIHLGNLGDKPYEIKGDEVGICTKMKEFDGLFNDSFGLELNATLPYVIPKEFKDQRAKITKRIRRFTEEYIQNETKNEPFLANWVKNHAEYRIAMDYMKYAFKRMYRNKLSLQLKEGFPTSYFDFWEEFPIDNPAALNSLNYQNYLQFYRKYLMANLIATTPYQDCKNLPSCNFYEMELEQLTKNLNGKIKDHILSQQIDYQLTRNNIHFLEKGFPIYLKEMSDSLLIEEIQQRKAYYYDERPFKFPENATLFQSDASGEQIFRDIKNRHQGRSTILYFWNTQTLIKPRYFYTGISKDPYKVLDSINFDLVLLAHHSTPNAWKDKIVELELEQDQWHLNEQQFNFFEDFYQEGRKKHRFYDSILEYENFVLAIDENGELTTIEVPFTDYRSLARMVKYKIKHNQKYNIVY